MNKETEIGEMTFRVGSIRLTGIPGDDRIDYAPTRMPPERVSRVALINALHLNGKVEFMSDEIDRLRPGKEGIGWTSN